MRATRTFAHELGLASILAAAGAWAWMRHAAAWGLGVAADVLGYDAAEYAVAARELAQHGHLATPFALPIDLVAHAQPPWPLSLVQPGLVLFEAALFRLAGPQASARLVLLLPFVAYLACAIVLAVATRRLLERRAPSAGAAAAAAAGLVVGLAFLLDPEAQHYAAGGFTEMPFTLGLTLAVAMIALGSRVAPWRFGVLLGLTGLFRGNMLWLAPLLAAAFAWSRPFDVPVTRRARVLAGLQIVLAYAVVLAPWWFYKLAAFGNPGWDLSRLSLWHEVGGRTWFSLNHLPELPDVPTGAAAVSALAHKAARSLPQVLLDLATGPRTLWLAALALAAIRFGRAPNADRAAARPESSASWVLLAMLAASIAVASITVPLLRYVAPARLVAEAAGLVATWALVWRMLPEPGARMRAGVTIAVAVLAIGWGMLQSGRGLREAQAVANQRGVPPTVLLRDLARELDAALEPDEPMMSNLGPTLGWYTRRPIVHLALTPADVDACRQRVPFRVVVLAFRDAGRAWQGWSEVVARPAEAPHHPEWNVESVRYRTTPEGFTVVWLELKPLRERLALKR